MATPMATKEAVLSPSKAPRSARPQRHQPTNEEIAERAYDIFLARGAAHGCDFDDWIQAEQELRQNH